MSEKLSAKDVKANAIRLMKEDAYEAALKNWMYLKKNTDDLDPMIPFQVGKCLEHLDSTAEAAKAYRQAITIMTENKALIQDKLFLETLISLGEVEKANQNFTSAIETYKCFLDYETRATIQVPLETMDFVKSKIEECEQEIEARIKGNGTSNGKNVPYPSNSTKSK